jgi:hypothetical protein
MMFFHEHKFLLLPQDIQEEINLSVQRYRNNLESHPNMKIKKLNELVKCHRSALIENHYFVLMFKEEETILDEIIRKRLGK